MTDLALYKDKQLKEPFVIENLGDVDVGDVATRDGYLYNSTPYKMVQISYQTADPDVKIINLPHEVEAESWVKVQVEYAPDKLRLKPLDTFVVLRGKKRIPPE